MISVMKVPRADNAGMRRTHGGPTLGGSEKDVWDRGAGDGVAVGAQTQASVGSFGVIIRAWERRVTDG